MKSVKKHRSVLSVNSGQMVRVGVLHPIQHPLIKTDDSFNFENKQKTYVYIYICFTSHLICKHLKLSLECLFHRKLDRLPTK